GSRRNKFKFWRRPLRAAARRGRWLCCSLLTYRPGYSSPLAPRQRAWGPAAKCEFISARALSTCRRVLRDRRGVPGRDGRHAASRSAGVIAEHVRDAGGYATDLLLYRIDDQFHPDRRTGNADRGNGTPGVPVK